MTEYEETRVKHCTCMSVVIGIRNQLRQHAIFLMLVAPYSIGHTPKIVCVCVKQFQVKLVPFFGVMNNYESFHVSSVPRPVCVTHISMKVICHVVYCCYYSDTRLKQQIVLPFSCL